VSTKAHDGSAVSVAGIVLAAGKGTRMKSPIPKVLHQVAGRPMVEWVLGALAEAGVAKACVVLGDDLTGFEEFLEKRRDLTVAIQSNRKGTGDAVASAAFAFKGVRPAGFAAGRHHSGPEVTADWTLVCTGDTPALRGDVLKAFLADVIQSGAALGVLGFRPADPKGYGRLVGSRRAPERELEAIVEDRDTTPEQKTITVCNTGMIAARTDVLFDLVRELEPNNDQREYYLTDCVSLARKRGLGAVMHVAPEARDFAGVNDREQLAQVENWMITRSRV
jgi:bifunctional UDP-N-acetylglucosamine pyrophosphorylase/glucosamine-1-phosphate N-acetyltransferase